MALVIAALMVAGLSFDIPKYVLRPTVHRPTLLAIHSVVFCAWMLVYVVQNILIYAGRPRLHRMLGWFGLALALVMPPLGIATAIVMRRFNLEAFPSTDLARDIAFLAAPLSDIVAFTPCAWAGIFWRRRPDVHRRLMFLSTASIAEAGFGRLPIPGMATWFFIGNVLLYGAGMLHDRVTLGRVHPVYRRAVPLLILNEAVAMYLWLGHPAWWLALSRRMIGLG
ncbi:hypothetical protein [Sphingomonas profundi]|uniref:hypothetical protein n=1 Tax=Alterirhizorhabdus profundi TaxID=2681549 RepID=UPI0012E7389B|nr:hypothetical protein [Sphingomonas profundi]